MLLRTAMLLCALLSTSAYSAVIYVDQNAPGPEHDGISWETAFLTVQEGLAASTSGDQVWVAAGLYVERITLKAGVALYGGFPAGGGDWGSRDWSANATILDGNQGGVVVTSPSGAGDTTRIEGFTVQRGTTGVNCVSSSPTIANNTITNNAGSGVYADDGSSPTVHDNSFTANAGYPISIYCNNVLGRFTGNVGSGNGLGDVIEVRAGDVSTDQTWDRDGLPYLVTGGDVNVTGWNAMAHPVLTLSAGVELRFSQGCGLVVGPMVYSGSLICEGEPGAEVVLTAASGQPGGWKGLTFEEAGEGALTHCRVEYGGETTGANILGQSGRVVAIAECLVRGAAGDGVALGSGYYGAQSQLTTLTDCTVCENTGNGIVLTNSLPTVTSCQVLQNGGSGVSIRDTGGPS
jgi:parallel beta-helix repeat protein